MLQKLNSACLLILFIILIPSVLAQRVEAQESSNAAASYNEGLEYYRQGKYKEAVESLTKAIRLSGGLAVAAQNPKWRDAVIKLGVADSMLGNHLYAMATFSSVIMNRPGDEAKQIIRLDTDSAQAYYDLGTAYYISHGMPSSRDFSMEAAIESFKRAISLKPDYAEAYWYLGLSYDALQKYEMAVEAHKEAARLNPNRAESYNSLGLAYYALNRYVEAVEAFKKSITLKPDFVAPRYHLGMAYLALGDRQSAMKQYRILKKLSPEQAKEFRALLER